MESWMPIEEDVPQEISRVNFRVNSLVHNTRYVEFFGPNISVGDLKTLIYKDLFPGFRTPETISIVLQNAANKKELTLDLVIPANSTVLAVLTPLQKRLMLKPTPMDIVNTIATGQEPKLMETPCKDFMVRMAMPGPLVCVSEIEQFRHAHLGEGGFGTVSIVRWRGTFHAMKEIMTERSNEDRVKMELRLLNSLRHPLVLQLNFYAMKGRHVYLGMELARSNFVDLLDYKGPFTEDDARHYTAQIVLALDYLHQVKVIHKDIKPANILIMSDGYVKVGDFGQAEWSSVRVSGECGTQGWRAPQVEYGKVHTTAMDIWSLGFVLYHMLTMMHPEDIGFRINIEILDDTFSDSIRDLLESMVRFDPSERPTSKEILCSKWFQHIDLEQIYYKEIKAPFIPSATGQPWKSCCPYRGFK